MIILGINFTEFWTELVSTIVGMFTKIEPSYISFPGLGIKESIEINRIAITLPFGEGFPVYWYGIIITFGIICAFLYACWRAYNEKVKVDDLFDIAIYTVIFGVIGARLYYVFTKFENFKGENLIDTLKNICNLRDGGLAIYGGIICGCATIIVCCILKKINPLKVVDMAAPGVMIAQAIGRWGNFFNGEAYGGLVEKGSPLYFMRMGIISYNSIHDFPEIIDKGLIPEVHPAFLYESIWNIIGFTLITIFYRKKKFNGQVACMYLAWYGFGRMFIEGLRTDSLYVGIFRISQLVGLACFIIFGGLLIWGLIYSKRYNDEGFVSTSKVDPFLIPSTISLKEGWNLERAEIKAKKQAKAEAKAAAKAAKEEKNNGEDN